MTRQDIIRMAEEAGIKGPAPARQGFKMYANPQRLERFAALVAAAERKRIESTPWGAGKEWIARAVEAEREACAQLALQGTGEAVQTRTLKVLQSERQRIAAAIRARGDR